MHLEPLEPLEPRTHFSTATVVRTGNILTITGTEGADEITLIAGNPRFEIVVNGQSWNALNRIIKTVRIFGLKGDDRIVTNVHFKIRCSINAGDGNDIITGGGGNDSIWGQQGNDTIKGDSGANYIDGGAGDDHLQGKQYSFDVCHGGSGNDSLVYWENAYCTGIEHLTDIPPGFVEWPYPNQLLSLNRSNNKLIIEVSENIYSQDVVTFGEMTQTSPGIFTIPSTYTFLGGAAETIVSHQYDVTSAKGSTIIYKSHFIDPDENTSSDSSLPLFIDF